MPPTRVWMRRSERDGWGRGMRPQGNGVEQVTGRTCTKRPSLSACAFLGHSPSRRIAGAATTLSFSALIHFFSFAEKATHFSPAKLGTNEGQIRVEVMGQRNRRLWSCQRKNHDACVLRSKTWEGVSDRAGRALTDHVRFDRLTLDLNPAAVLPELGELTEPPAATTPPEHQRRVVLARVAVRRKGGTREVARTVRYQGSAAFADSMAGGMRFGIGSMPSRFQSRAAVTWAGR